ncbi:MAG TPA: histidine triad nucleotide-binding protein [Ktedonobacteraceae bacterium]|nr:histidine triad nucleotide-binding protein [Ktedonobacteraceae bacterium]
MENCLFCKIAAGEIPSNIVYSDPDIVAFADINPQAPHHILIIPRQHIGSMTDITPEDGPMLAKIFTVAQQLAHEQGLDERGYRFVTNVGPDAGQSVFHLHFHMLGGRHLKWPPG